jgi:hypothetical protein
MESKTTGTPGDDDYFSLEGEDVGEVVELSLVVGHVELWILYVREKGACLSKVMTLSTRAEPEN